MEEKRNIKRQIRLRALWLYVAFFVVVAAISLLQLNATRSKEVQQ